MSWRLYGDSPYFQSTSVRRAARMDFKAAAKSARREGLARRGARDWGVSRMRGAKFMI